MLEVCVFATSVGPVHSTTVLPAKSDSDFMFCLQVIRDLQSIDQLCINPIGRSLVY